MDRFFNYTNFYPILPATNLKNETNEIMAPQFLFQSPATASHHLIGLPSVTRHSPQNASSGSPISETTTSYTPDTSVNQPFSPSPPTTKHPPLKRKRRARGLEGENRACTICGEPASGYDFHDIGSRSN